MSPTTRPVTMADVPALTQLLLDNREFLAPWEPLRDDSFYTVEGQRAVVSAALEQREQGTTLPRVILNGAGDVAGRITLNGIVRRAFQSCSVGYWVGAADNGNGLATAAVRDIMRVAFDDYGLHRIQAETLVHNVASQRVLERNGFVRFGLAPQYLNIAGEWQDHLMYQAVNSGRA